MKNQVNQPKSSQVTIEQITADKLDNIIEKKTHTIIDVRDPKGIEKQGSIPDAVNISFESIDHAIVKHHENYNSIFDGDGPFLFCCTGGVMSYMAAIKAYEHGIKNIYNLEGGHSAWIKHNKAAVVSQ